MRLILLTLTLIASVQMVAAQEVSDARVKELALEAILENPQIIMQAVAILEKREKDRAASGAQNVRLRLEQDVNSCSCSWCYTTCALSSCWSVITS